MRTVISRTRRLRRAAPGSWGECPSCKTFCLGTDMRERERDGLLVCPECAFREPRRRVVIPGDSRPRESAPIQVAPPTPAPTEWPPFDMRRKPNYRNQP